MTRLLLLGCRLFTGCTVVDDHALLIDGDRIVDLVPDTACPDATVERLPDGALLAPGFIDLQVNGAGGVLFNRTPTAEAALAIAAAMRPFGVTGLLPTFITDTADGMAQACDAAVAAAAVPVGGVLGVHLEGPFISPERRGVHAAEHVRAPTGADLERIAALPGRLAAADARALLTLAPEVVDDAALRRLAASGVILSAGHTAATLERTADAIALGVRGFTHLGNAMPPVAGRAPGPVVAALADPTSWCAIIADGVHIHPAWLRVMLAAKPRGRVMLVSDAMAPTGTDATEFELQGRTILRRDGRLVTADGTLAGADIDLASAVRNAVRLLGVSLEEALRMASLYPAAFLRLDHRLGQLAPGYRADLALITPAVDVLGTWVAGRRVFSRR